MIEVVDIDLPDDPCRGAGRVDDTAFSGAERIEEEVRQQEGGEQINRLASIGAVIAAAIEALPDNENAWLALRLAFDPVVQQADTDPRAEALGRLMLEHPGLQRDKDATWASAIAKTLMPRLSSDHRNTIQVDALVASAIACLHVAQEHWLKSAERISLGVLLDKTMKAVRPFE